MLRKIKKLSVQSVLLDSSPILIKRILFVFLVEKPYLTVKPVLSIMDRPAVSSAKKDFSQTQILKKLAYLVNR